MNWQFITSGIDGHCELFGVNIFEYHWHNTGERIEVEDPHYKQKHLFIVWEVLIDEEIYTFAAGEFSNMIWGFYESI